MQRKILLVCLFPACAQAVEYGPFTPEPGIEWLLVAGLLSFVAWQLRLSRTLVARQVRKRLVVDRPVA